MGTVIPTIRYFKKMGDYGLRCETKSCNECIFEGRIYKTCTKYFYSKEEAEDYLREKVREVELSK